MRKLLGLVLLGVTVAGCGVERLSSAPPSTPEAAAATPEAATPTTAAAAIVPVTDTPTTASVVTTTEATTTTAAAPVEAPVVLAADGANATAPFYLAGGTYRSTWQTFGPGDCYHSAKLKPGFLVDVMTASGISQGETYVYDIEPGEYYVDVITGPSPRCRWQITLTPA